MSTSLQGLLAWSGSHDEEGNREYRATYRVVSDSKFDGPSMVSVTSGLPVPGSIWAIGNDFDTWAWCRENMVITPLVTKEPNYYWDVEFFFSTKDKGVPPNKQRCNDTKIDDPLLEPARISGTFAKYSEEAATDVYGYPITNSAWEQIRGPQVEFDRSRPSVKIEMNLPYLDLPLYSALTETVNHSPLWGLPPRCIKLSNTTWERKFYGSCNVYYTVSFEFDINKETFDRLLIDEGTKVLKGEWTSDGKYRLKNVEGAAPDRNNPSHFVRFKGRDGEASRVILNHGLPAGATIIGTESEYDPEFSVIFTDAGQFKQKNTQPPGANTSGLTVPTPIVAYLREGGRLLVQAGATHRYVVTALSATGETTQSAEVAVTPSDNVLLNVDDAVWNQPQRKARLVWGKVTGATGYRIYRLVQGVDTGFRLLGGVRSGAGQGGALAPGAVFVAKYGEGEFLALGIPAVLA